MNRLFILSLCLLALVLSLSACKKSTAATEGQLATKTDLMHHNFELKSINGVAYDAERAVNVEFGENFHMSGRVCNNFSGKGELENGILKTGPMAATKMLCDDALNQLEYKFFQMLEQGATATLTADLLTLQQGETTLVYSLRDYVK